MDEKKIFVCKRKKCKKQYTTRFSLERHFSLKHKKTKRFICKVCERTLSSKNNLMEHSYTHTEERPMVCPFPGCGKLFRQASMLSVHKRIHVHTAEAIQMGWKTSYKLGMENRIKEILKLEEIERNQGLSEPQIEFQTIPKIFEPETLKLKLDIPK